MKIHEHQAKQLLARHGLPVPRGLVAVDPVGAAAAVRELGDAGRGWVVKAQIHAGGRGKGGGIVRVASPEEAAAATERILARPLVTAQTGPAGHTVRAVLVEQAVPIERELYLAITLDRLARQLVVVGSPDGGMDIEQVAAVTPERLFRTHVDPLLGLTDFQSRWLGVHLGLAGPTLEHFVKLAGGLFRLYVGLDCALAEINPLVVTSDGTLLALDAKLAFDPAGLERHPELLALRDPGEEDPLEYRASVANLSYVHLDGDIGCMVNGAGLAMATMDLVLHAGGRPANFLDVGGAATVERVAEALRLILDDRRVRGVFVNIFGGIVRCDIVAEGLLLALGERALEVPLVVRLVGTREAEGRALLARSGLPITAVQTMAEGAAAITRLLQAGPSSAATPVPAPHGAGEAR